MNINQFKLLVDSDSLPSHKVLTVLDQQVTQEDDAFIPDQLKGPDLSDTMKSELDNVVLQFSQQSLVTPHWQNIQSKLQLLRLVGLQFTLSQFILMQSSRKNWTN